MKPGFPFRQAWLAPTAMLVPIIASFFVTDYDWVAQHMSVLSLREDWSKWALKCGAFLAGVSVFIFAFGCFVRLGSLRWSFTGITSAAYGVAMMFNGIYPMGSPLHGLYGLAIFSVLVPAFYAAEFQTHHAQRWLTPLCLTVSLLGLLYMWFLLVGLDPPAISGLTQRVFSLISFGWFAVISQLAVEPNRAQ